MFNGFFVMEEKMELSFNVIQRVLEEAALKDPEYRKLMIERGVFFLSAIRKTKTDSEIIGILKSLNVAIDKSKFLKVAENFLSAEDMVEWICLDYGVELETLVEDKIWICLVVLWEQWIPERPSLEMLDDLLHNGYQLLDDEDDIDNTYTVWLRAWNEISKIIKNKKLNSIYEFESLFKSDIPVSIWLTDFATELFTYEDKKEKYLKMVVEICEECLQLFPNDDSGFLDSMKDNLASAYFNLGYKEKADTMFREWLTLKPQWGCGWVAWADCYCIFDEDLSNLDKTEQILLEGLSIPDVNDKWFILESLNDLYFDMGDEEKLEKIQLELDEFEIENSNFYEHSDNDLSNFINNRYMPPEFSPLDSIADMDEDEYGDEEDDQFVENKQKIGRNEPCPCGSGKKYKKCCGK